MTAPLSASGASATRLPLWRLIAGAAVLGILLVLLVSAGFVYADNYLLDRYMRDLATQPASASLSDSALTGRILEKAGQLGLSLRASDIQITRSDGRPRIRIAKYTVQTKLAGMDLRLPEASSR